MSTLHLDYPDELAQAIKLTPAELAAQIRLMAALKMFELGKLSSGKAAQLAAMSRAEFLEMCGRYRVGVFNYPSEALKNELQSDVRQARQAKL